MTIAEFLRRLAKLKGQFELRNGNEIRTRGSRISCQCPIEALAGVKRGLHIMGARKLGLTDDQMGKIVSAADDNIVIGVHSPSLRRKMLKALGLKERA